MNGDTSKIEEYLRQLAERDHEATVARQGAAISLLATTPQQQGSTDDQLSVTREILVVLREVRQALSAMQQPPRRYG